jgi:hypothetical protein
MFALAALAACASVLSARVSAAPLGSISEFSEGLSDGVLGSITAGPATLRATTVGTGSRSA